MRQKALLINRKVPVKTRSILLPKKSPVRISVLQEKEQEFFRVLALFVFSP